MAKAVRRIGDIIREEDALPPIRPASDFLNRDMNLIAVEYKEGDKSPYAVMTITLDNPDLEQGETSEEQQISCGATTVMTQLNAIDLLSDLPLPIKLVKHKDTRMLKLV